MRLLAVTNDFPPEIGGIGSYVFEMYRRLPEQGIEVCILAPAMPGDAAFDAAVSEIEIVRFPSRIVRQTRALNARVAELAQGRDIITLGSTLPMGFAATKTGLPVVLHTHNSEIIYDSVPGTRWLMRRLISQTTLVTSLAEYTRLALRPALGNKPIIDLQPAVDLERFHPSVDGSVIRKRFNVPLGKRLIVHAGRLAPRKGQDVLISAMPKILQAVPDAMFLIVGSGPYERKLRKLAAELRLSDDVVRFAGPVDYSDLPQVYAAADVFATPCRSRYGGREVEGFGQVFLEAQAAGKPVIVGNSGGAPSTTVDGATGFIVDSLSVEEITQRAVQLLSDPEFAQAMGCAGRKHVEENFGWDARVAMYADVLRGVVYRRQAA